MIPRSLNVFNDTPSVCVNFAVLCPTIHSIPASFAASNNLCVIIPSKSKYLIPDWPEIFGTNSLIGILNISFESESNASASNDSFKSEYFGLHISAREESLSFFNDGASSSWVICFATGLRISSTLFGVNSSTSIPSSALSSISILTIDFNSFRINPPALSPSINATTCSFLSHNSLIDSSIRPPSNASALSYLLLTSW